MVLRVLWPAAGLVMLVVGCAVVLTARSTADFGWIAYTPLDDGLEVAGHVVLVSRTQLVGLGVGLVGLVVLAASAGYLIGRGLSPRGGSGTSD